MATSTIVLLVLAIIVLFVIGGLNIDAALGIKKIDKNNTEWQAAYKYTVASSVICITMGVLLIGVAVYVGYKTRTVSHTMFTVLFSIALALCFTSTVLSIIAATKIKHGDNIASGGRSAYCHATSGNVYVKLIAASMCGAFMMALLTMGIVISKTDATDRLTATLKKFQERLGKVKEAIADPNTSKAVVDVIVRSEFAERGTDTGSDAPLSQYDI